MTLHIPDEYEAQLRAAATAAGYEDVETFVVDKLLGTKLASAAVNQSPNQRVGGQWKGQVCMAEDFDELPEDMQIAFGMKEDDGPAS